MFVEILILFLCHVNLGLSALNNIVLGSPSIICESKRIDLTLNTKEPFSGKIFIKGNAHRKECVTDFGTIRNNDSLNITELRTTIDYNICNTERIRSLSPIGVTYANTIVVQFHKTFITKGDKSYHIRCFYAETEKTVASNFEVSMIPTGAIFHDMEMPNCAYTVRSQTPNGPLIRSAKVGDIVFHRWECRGNNDFYGMIVHSCFVENTNGVQSQILDAYGCSTDLGLLPNLIYSNDLGLAYSETQVFKYPDYSYVHFRCQIRLCTKLDGSCKGITPPVCTKRKARAIEKSFTLNNRNSNMDVVTKEILVLDENEASNSTLLSTSTLSNSPEEAVSYKQFNDWQLCANRIVLITILMAFIFLFVMSLAFVAYVMYNQNKLLRNKQHFMESSILAHSESSLYKNGGFFDNPTFPRSK